MHSSSSSWIYSIFLKSQNPQILENSRSQNWTKKKVGKPRKHQGKFQFPEGTWVGNFQSSGAKIRETFNVWGYFQLKSEKKRKQKTLIRKIISLWRLLENDSQSWDFQNFGTFLTNYSEFQRSHWHWNSRRTELSVLTYWIYYAIHCLPWVTSPMQGLSKASAGELVRAPVILPFTLEQSGYKPRTLTPRLLLSLNYLMFKLCTVSTKEWL